MSGHLLFDDDGAFRAGTELANTGSSHQVELASGKRVKVKAANVLGVIVVIAAGLLFYVALSQRTSARLAQAEQSSRQ